MTALLEKQLVEEAVLLAETIAAVEATKNSPGAEEVHVVLKFYLLHLSKSQNAA